MPRRARHCDARRRAGSFAGPLFLLLAPLSGCMPPRAAPRVEIALAGAHIPVELVESWLRDARRVRFATRRVQFYLSQHGFQHLARGTCDLACTDRTPTPDERRAFGELELEGYRVAFYGFGLYVHPSNPVDSIFARHLSLVLQRKVTNWSELGGPDLPIRVLGPRKSTRGGDILARQARIVISDATWDVLPSNTEIVDAVASDPAALGFAAVGLDQGVRYLGLRMERAGAPAFPSLEEIEEDRYGLAKVIYVYAVAPPNAAARSAIDCLFSEEGQDALRSSEVWPIPRERARVAPPR
jgi:ABC-type phosphate transport system substrate-binding protein